MNEMEKYLTAMETAVKNQDKKALELLEEFSAYVYQQISIMSDNASGEDRVVLDEMRKRAQAVIIGMAQSGDDIWL